MSRPSYGPESLLGLGCYLSHLLEVERKCEPIDLRFEKLGLVLIDGFSSSLAERIGIEARRISSTFPSSTAPAITTIFTAQPPCTHRVVGEKVWSKELAGLINPLRYTYSALKVSNELRDVKREKDLFRLRTFIAESKHVVTAVLPWWLSSSELTSTLYGGAEVVPCYNVWDCLHLFQTSLGKGTLTILYLNDVDVLSHKYGHGTKVVTSAAFQIVEQLRRMSSKIPVVLTSDHGFVDVEKRVFLDQDATLSQMLELPPFGEPRALFMNSRFDLKTFLYNRYPKLEVMSREEVEAHQLMGQCTDYSRLDFDYVAVPVDLSSYRYRLTEQDNILFKGEHGGLTSEELEVPLVTLGG